MITLQFKEIPKEIFYKLETEDAFRSTGLTATTNSVDRPENAEHVLLAEAKCGEDENRREICRCRRRNARTLRT